MHLLWLVVVGVIALVVGAPLIVLAVVLGAGRSRAHELSAESMNRTPDGRWVSADGRWEWNGREWTPRGAP